MSEHEAIIKYDDRVHDNRLIEKHLDHLIEEQFGFVNGKSTTDAIFALRQLQERHIEGQQELHCVFIDLEKANDTAPREELTVLVHDRQLRGCHQSKCIRLVKGMYHQCETLVRCAVGTREPFAVEVDLQQGSAFSLSWLPS